ncbi:hypothetical protein SNEBB_000068 [Seison nebaliae]|nr:hypothetical protein SNEBB_000068 [Seison nebaliae]
MQECPRNNVPPSRPYLQRGSGLSRFNFGAQQQLRQQSQDITQKKKLGKKFHKSTSVISCTNRQRMIVPESLIEKENMSNNIQVASLPRHMGRSEMKKPPIAKRKSSPSKSNEEDISSMNEELVIGNANNNNNVFQPQNYMSDSQETDDLNLVLNDSIMPNREVVNAEKEIHQQLLYSFEQHEKDVEVVPSSTNRRKMTENYCDRNILPLSNEQLEMEILEKLKNNFPNHHHPNKNNNESEIVDGENDDVQIKNYEYDFSNEESLTEKNEVTIADLAYPQTDGELEESDFDEIEQIQTRHIKHLDANQNKENKEKKKLPNLLSQLFIEDSQTESRKCGKIGNPMESNIPSQPSSEMNNFEFNPSINLGNSSLIQHKIDELQQEIKNLRKKNSELSSMNHEKISELSQIRKLKEDLINQVKEQNEKFDVEMKKMKTQRYHGSMENAKKIAQDNYALRVERDDLVAQVSLEGLKNQVKQLELTIVKLRSLLKEEAIFDLQKKNEKSIPVNKPSETAVEPLEANVLFTQMDRNPWFDEKSMTVDRPLKLSKSNRNSNIVINSSSKSPIEMSNVHRNLPDKIDYHHNWKSNNERSSQMKYERISTNRKKNSFNNNLTDEVESPERKNEEKLKSNYSHNECEEKNGNMRKELKCSNPIERTRSPNHQLKRTKSPISIERNKSPNENDNDIVEERRLDNKIEKLLRDGRRIIVFANGTEKMIYPNNTRIILNFFNGDKKEVLEDKTEIYFYSKDNVKDTMYADGKRVIAFSSGQIETIFPNGKKEVRFPDDTVEVVNIDGTKQTTFADGLIVNINKNGDEELIHPNGEKEFYTKEFRKRMFADGSSKTIYSDGKKESIYSNQRIRVKDKNGKIIRDEFINI